MVFEKVMSELGLAARPQQLRLVSAARSGVHENAVRMVQAGTGTGKSYALLCVALETAQASGLPSVVICPNNSLIDQYVYKDVPAIQQAAGGVFTHLKGRAKYICANSPAIRTRPSRLNQGHVEEYLRLIKPGELEWAKAGLPEEFGCPGYEHCKKICLCGADDEPDRQCICPPVCGALEARLRAADSDVIITNGHVLAWDYLVGMFSEGTAHLLPKWGALFVDECHEIEAIVRSCMSTEIRETSPAIPHVPGLKSWINTMAEELQQSGDTEMLIVPTDETVMAFAKQARTAYDTLVAADRDGLLEDEIISVKKLLDLLGNESERFITTLDVHDPDKAVLKLTCVNAAPAFNHMLTLAPSVLVSGTIPKSDRRRLGLPAEVVVEDVGHPFDYSKSKLIVSKFDGRGGANLRGRVASAIRAINETEGGTLMLFTSWADLELVTPLVAQGLKRGIPVFMQSREDPATLAQDVIDFKNHGNAVLAGVRSLFTGIDIPGPALRQVIVWKLPYPAPTIEIRRITDLFGQQAYRDMMLMLLTQGIGRMVRTPADAGRVIIMDNRAKRLNWDGNGMTRHLAEFSRA